MPLVPPCTSSVSPGCRPAAVEHVRPDGEEGLGQAGRLDVAQARRAPAGTGRPARRRARRSRRRRPARRPGRRRCEAGRGQRLGVAVDDRARDLEPRQVGGARRHRVEALALQHVGPVDARRRDADQQPRRRRRPASGRSARRSTSGAPGAVISMAFMASSDAPRRPAAASQPRARLARAGAACSRSSSAFIDSLTRPFSSVSSTLTRTIWPSFR